MDSVAFEFVATGEGERGVASNTQQGKERYGGRSRATPQITASAAFIHQIVSLGEAVNERKQHSETDAAHRKKINGNKSEIKVMIGQ